MPATTPAIALRVPTDEDAGAWRRLFDDAEVMRFQGGTSHDLDYYREFAAGQRQHAREWGVCLYTVVDRATDAVVGFAGAQPWPHEWGPAGEIEIGWRLGRASWGRGYATVAARAALERARAAGISRVVAMVDARNERSIAVTERLGMRRTETYLSPSKATALCHRLDLTDA